MNEEFAGKVRSAAIAGWWTLLIAVVFLSVQWFVLQFTLKCQPAWVVRLWSPYTPAEIQAVSLWVVGVFKMILWIFAMILIWLSLWARALRKSQQ